MNYDTLATDQTITKTIAGLNERGFKGVVVENKEEAMVKIKEMIPVGASVMNGSSRTLEQVGCVEYLKSGEHGWNNLHQNILKEEDKEKQALLRKYSVISDYYLGSVHALTKEGEFIIASNTGSQLGAYSYGSPHLIWVVGAQKIVKDLEEGMRRLHEYVLPLESERANEAYNITNGSFISKLLIFNREITPDRVSVIIVNEKLGF